MDNRVRIDSTIKRFAFAFILVLSIMIIDLCAFADEKYESYDVSFSSTRDGKTLNSQFYYNDEMMLSNANELSTDLAKVSVGLSTAAYQKQEITNCMGAMGYELVGGKPYNYDRTASYQDNDFVAYTIGHKEISGHNVYIIAVKGTGGDEGWISNFHLGTGDYHEGFILAASEILNTLSLNISGTNNIFLITGHSRGAAVANIVAGELTKNYSMASPDHIFGYTFACPAVKIGADQSLSNIRNYNAPGDVIAAVPLKDWGYSRYGQDIPLSLESDVYENFKNRFRDVFSTEFGGVQTTYEFVSAMKTIAAEREDFYTLEHQMAFDVLGWLIGGSHEETKQAIYDRYTKLGLFTVGASALLRVLNDAAISGIQTAINSNHEEDQSFYIEIDLALNDTANYTQEEFEEWLSSRSTLINRIKNELGITVTTRSDLESARASLESRMDEVSYATANLATLADLYMTTGGSLPKLKDSVWHSHQQETYVLWINSMYYGYKGWANYDKAC